jgi:hypothetical protein
MAPAEDHVASQDPDAPGPPIEIADSGDTGEGGKLKMIVQLVKKALGVKDIAAMYVPYLVISVEVADEPYYFGRLIVGDCRCLRRCWSRWGIWSLRSILTDRICSLRECF